MQMKKYKFDSYITLSMEVNTGQSETLNVKSESESHYKIMWKNISLWGVKNIYFTEHKKIKTAQKAALAASFMLL